jgi:cation diffusion facilitator CzcD-associated flavoprotein CzcO
MNLNAAQGDARDLEVAIVGSGFAGLGMAIRLREAGIEDFAVFEKAAAVGGTWRDNTYPGLECDIPAMFYSFSFEMKTDWSSRYPPQPEILAYLEHCVDKYGLRPHIRLGAEVIEARFDERAGRWRILTADGGVVRARVLVSGTGQLNRPNIPDLPGLDSFRGRYFHSARWDHGHDLASGRVAVVGNAASAVQFIPEIAPKVQRLTVFQRSAQWLVRQKNRRYSGIEKWLFGRFPFLVRGLRGWLWLKHELRWPVFARGGGLFGRLFAWIVLRDMRKRAPEPALQAALTPDYPIGCKRVLLSGRYYETLRRDNVELVTDAVREFTPAGVVAGDGREYPADTVIFATGFKSTEFLTPMKVYGLGGRSLEDEEWAAGAHAYLGMAVPGFPNFFLLYGPNTNLGHNSIIFMLEIQIDYVLQCLRVMRERGLEYLDLREDAMRRWQEECRVSLARTVWATGCRSWYQTADGKITNNWPYSTLTYWWRMRRPRLADYRQTPAGGADRRETAQRAGSLYS